MGDMQDRIDELLFKIVRSEKYSEASLTTLAEAIPKYFGPTMKHRVEFVEQIPKTKRGKYQFSICNLKEEDIPTR